MNHSCLDLLICNDMGCYLGLLVLGRAGKMLGMGEPGF